MKILGIFLALFELSGFLLPIFLLRKYAPHLAKMNVLQYYWLFFTVLTGVWEVFFIINYKETTVSATNLLKHKTHVWTNKYEIDTLLPWKFSQVFYSEYGAYADRKYMASNDVWSRIIESTHAIFCGLFAFLALLNYIHKKNGLHSKYTLTMAVAMGSQLMNSLLYMGEYFIQINDSHSNNYNSPTFPTGVALVKRPFMYINIFWTLMPSLIIGQNLLF